VVTEGILTRMIQSDPELTGIGAVIFDEFHERSLNADLGLALTWEVRGALRPDLVIVVMSATLDAAPVAALLDQAPVITSEGRAFAVDTRWLVRSPAAGMRYEAALAGLIADAVARTEGGVLVFLPGEGEIRRTESLLDRALPADCRVQPAVRGDGVCRPARRHRPRRAGAQGGAGHLHRRNVADHSRHPGGGRWRAGAAGAV
jgi:ATP-dependent helicase HrpB